MLEFWLSLREIVWAFTVGSQMTDLELLLPQYTKLPAAENHRIVIRIIRIDLPINNPDTLHKDRLLTPPEISIF